jgi:predicted RNA-binding protein associated with RNAse of E/G family
MGVVTADAPVRLIVGQELTIRASALDGAARWSLTGEVATDAGDEMTLRVREGTLVDGPEPWTLPADGVLHLWRGQPYSILVTTRARRFPYWYCSVHTPARPTDGVITVTDLGLDVQLFADGRYSVGGDAPDPATQPELARLAHAAVDELVALIRRKAPPFG